MKRLITYSVALVALAVLFAASAFASQRHESLSLHARPATGRTRHAAVANQEVRSLRRGIAWHRSRTWYWQTRADVGHTPSSHAELRTRSVAYLHWIDRLWSKRRVHAKKVALGPIPLSRDWLTSVRLVQRAWPGTSTWLLTCSAHEGGHGPWKPNNEGSGVGGWMQYASGTFFSDYDGAVSEARRLHRPLPAAGTRDWYSAEGQAYAAGYARLYTDYSSSSHWTDPYCA